MKVEKICEQCGKQFRVYLFQIKKGNGKYCSIKCYRESQKSKIKKMCEQCGKLLKTFPSRIKNGVSKYCSMKCYRESQKTKLVQVKCLQCKKIFIVHPRKLESRKRKYCSNLCYGKSNIGKKYSEETLEKKRSHTKENHGNWKGGKEEGYKRNRMNIKYRLSARINSAIRRRIFKNNYKNRKRIFDLLGYSMEFLEKHLNKTMPDGYTWQDFFDGKLHIDHIIPIKEFNYSTPNDLHFKECWALNNLRLLPAKENMSKHAKIIKPYQICLNI